jgi:hypothetical protein
MKNYDPHNPDWFLCFPDEVQKLNTADFIFDLKDLYYKFKEIAPIPFSNINVYFPPQRSIWNDQTVLVVIQAPQGYFLAKRHKNNQHMRVKRVLVRTRSQKLKGVARDNP